MPHAATDPAMLPDALRRVGIDALLAHWCPRTRDLLKRYPGHADAMLKIGDAIRLQRHRVAERLRRRLERLGYGKFALPERNQSKGMWAWMARDIETNQHIGGHLTMKDTNKLTDEEFDRFVWWG